MSTALSPLERRFLEYHPNETTWLCPHHPRLPMVNPGTAEACHACNRPRAHTPWLAWPIYILALLKTGQEAPPSGT